MKTLDVIGVTLLLFAILLAVMFPTPDLGSIGYYSIADLFPVIVGTVGVLCIIVARFDKRQRDE